MSSNFIPRSWTLWLRSPWILGVTNPSAYDQFIVRNSHSILKKMRQRTLNRSVLSWFLTVFWAQTHDTGRFLLFAASPNTNVFDEMTELLKLHFSLSHELYRGQTSWVSAWWGSLDNSQRRASVSALGLAGVGIGGNLLDDLCRIDLYVHSSTASCLHYTCLYGLKLGFFT